MFQHMLFPCALHAIIQILVSDVPFGLFQLLAAFSPIRNVPVNVALRTLLDSAAVVEDVTACSSSLPSSGGCCLSKQTLAPQLLPCEAGEHNTVDWHTDLGHVTSGVF